MKSKYDMDEKTPSRVVRMRLKEARAEGKIYVIARIVGILRGRGLRAPLAASEKKELLRSLALVRNGRKVLAKWLPIGYQIARFFMLVRGLAVKDIAPDKRDVARIRRAAYRYKRLGDWHSRRQLRSLISTAEFIGVSLYKPRA